MNIRTYIVCYTQQCSNTNSTHTSVTKPATHQADTFQPLLAVVLLGILNDIRLYKWLRAKITVEWDMEWRTCKSVRHTLLPRSPGRSLLSPIYTLSDNWCLCMKFFWMCVIALAQIKCYRKSNIVLLSDILLSILWILLTI